MSAVSGVRSGGDSIVKNPHLVVAGEKLCEISNAQFEAGFEQIDKFETKCDDYLNTCTDGEDDGKLGFKDISLSFLKGVGDHFIDQFKDIATLIKEHPRECLIGLGVCAVVGGTAIAAFGIPVLVMGMGVAGLVTGTCTGIKAIVNGVKAFQTAKNAKTDAEAKTAISQLGGCTVDAVESAVLVHGSAGQVVSTLKTLKTAEGTASIIAENADDILKNIDDIAERAMNGGISSEEAEILKNFCGNYSSCAGNIVKMQNGIRHVASMVASTPLISSNLIDKNPIVYASTTA